MTTIDARANTRAVVERMAEAAGNVLAGLSPEQRAQAAFPFPANDERHRWFYTPTNHGGLPLGEMTPAQQQRAMRLVSTGLSIPGYVTASTIIGLENVLDQKEGWRNTFFRDRGDQSRSRDPGMYFISIFGEPGGAAPWGWRFGGHHISLHYTVVDGGIVSPTPTFFGAHPAEAPLGGGHLLRPLAGEEDLGRELLNLLDAEQRAIAVVSPSAPWDLVVANRPAVEDGLTPPGSWEIFRESFSASDVETRQKAQERTREHLGFTDAHLEATRFTTTPKGLSASRMNAGQQEALRALIRQYINRMPEEIAAIQLERLSGDALTQVHFLWAGSAERRRPHYYRLQGPRLLVEYDNVQDDTNHIHSVWRDPEGDFGTDILAAHYATSHQR